MAFLKNAQEVTASFSLLTSFLLLAYIFIDAGCDKPILECHMKPLTKGALATILVFFGYLFMSAIANEYATLKRMEATRAWFLRLFLMLVVISLSFASTEHRHIFDDWSRLCILLVAVALLSDPFSLGRSLLVRIVGISDKFWGKYPPARTKDLLRPFGISLFYFFLFPFVLT